jgi:hypothetical protein
VLARRSELKRDPALYAYSLSEQPMITIAMALAIAVAPPTLACGRDPSAAQAWVRLVDDSRWDESWNAAGALFQSRMARTQWASTIQPVRKPLGQVSSRLVRSTTKTTRLPGAPDGQYQVVQLVTRFENKNDATDTVVLACEPSGWKVDGYFIR